MLPSVTPVATRIARIRLKYSRASAAERTSGWLTISMSGTPLRLKSSAVIRSESASPSCSDLPASSSRWTRMMPTRRVPPRGLELERAVGRQRAIVLRDLVPLRQVRDRNSSSAQRSRSDARVQPSASAALTAEFHGAPVEHRQRARKPEADRTGVDVGRRAKLRAAAAEQFARRLQLRMDLETDDRLKRHHAIADC